MGDFGILAPGEWLAADRNAFELAVIADRATVIIHPWGKFQRDTTNGKWVHTPDNASAPKSILLVRSGAWGDLLFLTPVLRALHLAGIKVALSCFESHRCLFDGAALVDEFLPYPAPAKEADRFEYVISLENVIELGKGVHATDALAAPLGVIIRDYHLIYQISQAEQIKTVDDFPRTNRPRLGVQLQATTANRNYPMKQWMAVVRELIARGWEIYVFGLPRQLALMQENPYFKKMDRPFREAASFLATCDAFCGVTSVWLHMADALRIPAVGLYGPVDWREWSAHAEKTTSLSGMGDCSPCYWYEHGGMQFPPNSPCTEGRECVVLASIKPERIVAKVDQLRP